jgi:hypothetical protein
VVAEGGAAPTIWPPPTPLGPYVLDRDAFLLGDPQVGFYTPAGLLHHRGAWWRFAWRHAAVRGQFFGELSDPMPLTVDAAGSLWVEDRPEGGDAGAGSA